MDIRDFFRKQAERNEEKQRSKARAPVIIEDDDEDFKPSASKGGAGGMARGAKKSSQEGVKRKRRRARITCESDSEEEAAPKKPKPSPKRGEGVVHAKVEKGKKTIITTPKRQEVKSVSAFFGSAPIKRSSDYRSSKPGTGSGSSKTRDGGTEEEGGGGKDVVVCIPESPIETAGHELHDEEVAGVRQEEEMEGVQHVLELHEDKDFSKTLEELDDQSSQPSSSTSQFGPPSKKLKLMMEKLPVKISPSKPHTKSNTNEDSDFTDSPIWKQETQTVRRSPRVKGRQKNVADLDEKATPTKQSQLVEKVEKAEKAAVPRSSKAKRGITYIDLPLEQDRNLPEEKKSEPKYVPAEKAAKSSSPSKQKTIKPDVTSPSKHKIPAVTSPSKHKIPTITSPSKHKIPAVTSPSKHKIPSITSPSKHKIPVVTSPSKHIIPAVTSPSKHKIPAITSPSKHKIPAVTSPLKQSSTTPVSTKHQRPPTSTPKSGTPVTKKADVASPTTPIPPKPTRSDSYRSYLNRSGPRAPGSKPIPDGEEDCLDGLTFVITGVLESMEREQASDLIKKYGGRVTSSISKKTSYLVVGEEAGQSKLAKASQCGTEKIDEDELLNLIRTRPAKKAKRAAPPSKKGAPKKATKQKSPTVSEPLTPKSHATPKSQIPTPTQDHASTSAATTTPKRSHVTTPVLITTEGPESLMWVDKYRPKSTKQIIGQQGEKSNAKKLARWLLNWERNYGQADGRKASGWGGSRGSQDDGSAFRAALLSGPPGVGKTTTAVLVCEEAGYTYMELNASATRNKQTLHEVASHLGCLSLDAFVEGRTGEVSSGRRHALIMDEVDGMAGNEDRGGVQEVIAMIKTTRVPIICICNDRQHPKIRSLANYCFDLRFYKPKVEQIRGPMMSVCFREGVQIKPQALSEIIMASGQDVRQVLHNLSVWSAADKSLSFEQAKETAQGAKKERKMGPFDVVKSVFMPMEGDREMTLNEKSSLFFNDYNIASLFVQENYASVKPLKAKGNLHVTLDLVARAADSICDGELVEKKIRSTSRWELLPLQAMFSSVLPGEYMRGYLGRPNFPQFLGNNSKRGRFDRTLQELQRHTRVVTSCNKTEFGMDYLPFLRSKLTKPLINEGSEGVSEVIATMENYDLLREDWDSILELAQFTGRPETAQQIPSKVKASFTRSYNKEAHTTHYSVVAIAKKSSRVPTATTDYGDENENEEYTSEPESDEDIATNPMIKTGKKKGVESGKEAESSSGKGKGRGGSQGTSKKGKTKI